MIDFRIGLGYDSHRLIKKDDNDSKPFVLAGIEIPHYKRCVAHSDGDVLLHSLCDALLGAAALRDIGTHFPDTDPKYKDIDSQILTREVAEMVTNKGWEINNIDITIIAEKPKMAPYIEPMIQNLSTILNLKPERISIKAKTNEKLDAVGQEEAIVVHSIVSLLNRNKS